MNSAPETTAVPIYPGKDAVQPPYQDLAAEVNRVGGEQVEAGDLHPDKLPGIFEQAADPADDIHRVFGQLQKDIGGGEMVETASSGRFRRLKAFLEGRKIGRKVE